jgi:hypothetical protein
MEEWLRMTEKQDCPSDTPIVSRLINHMMDKCEPYPIMRFLFEANYVKKGYKLDWNKRVDEKGNWVNKGDVE